MSAHNALINCTIFLGRKVAPNQRKPLPAFDAVAFERRLVSGLAALGERSENAAARACVR